MEKFIFNELSQNKIITIFCVKVIITSPLI
jgi:hypothetical protein